MMKNSDLNESTNQSNIIQRIQHILKETDIIKQKYECLETIIIINSIDSIIIPKLALNMDFIKFLQISYNLLSEDEEYKLYLEILSKCSLIKSKMDEYNLWEYIEEMGKKDVFFEKVVHIKNQACINTSEDNKHVKRRKVGKRVSWSENIAEVKYIPVVDSDKPFRHGGYREKDYREAVVMKVDRTSNEFEDFLWYKPHKLDLENNFIPKVESEEIKIQAERESKNVEIRNSTEYGNKFIPSEVFEEETISNETIEIPIFDLRQKNKMTELNIGNIVLHTNELKITIDEVLNDPNVLQSIFNRK
ncbi:hypothetical protein CWI38_0255p0030 [Hamiltosporidium tvaerminnensis]|uniref:Uncharacterized protein n=1 Tax=Hamiltosporidium tvaerminnensis TaxID=1176355 RepID=A0A4Q9LYZ9_9MICR|nr:hypothetical protein CWI38_0255p0030 [Hamiltosporidium tvaerminnensis]